VQRQPNPPARPSTGPSIGPSIGYVRKIAALAAVALVAAACGPRFDVSEIQNPTGTTIVSVPLADGATVDATATSPDGAVATPSESGTTPTDGGTGIPLVTGDATQTGTQPTASTGTTDADSNDPTGDTATTPATNNAGAGGGSKTPTATAVDPGPKPGVTDTPCEPQDAPDDEQHIDPDLGCIRVGLLAPVTGAAPVPSDFESGVSLYWWEKAKVGGTHGRQVQFVVRDTQSKTDVATSQAQQLLQEGVFTIITLDRVEVQEVVGNFMERAGVPHVMVQAPTPYPMDWVNTFTISIDHTAQGRAIAEYWAKDLGAANGAKDVGIVREGTPALKPGADAMVARAKDFGLNIVANETIDPTQTSFTNSVLSVCGSGAEIVWLYMAPTPALTYMQQAATQGCSPTWFANSISWNLDLAQTNPAAPQFSGAFSPWVSVQSPRAKTYRDAFRKYNGSAADDLGLASWGLSEVLDSALEAVGPNLGRDTFRTAFQNLNVSDYDTWGPIDCGGKPPYNCSNHVAVYEDAGTTWNMVGDFRTFG
jgi:branched-chain amino acid transport system substrate-binding protein